MTSQTQLGTLYCLQIELRSDSTIFSLFLLLLFSFTLAESPKPDSATFLDSQRLNAIDADFLANDESTYDSNKVDVNRLMDNLRDEIRIDESIAMKSAILLKMLEVSVKNKNLHTICCGFVRVVLSLLSWTNKQTAVDCLGFKYIKDV